MRVTIATRIFTPEPAAAAFRLAALADGLRERNHDVTVLTSAAPAGLTDGVDDRTGPTVRRAPVLRDRRGQIRGYLQYLSFDVPLVFRLLFGRRSDVVVSEPPPTTGAVVRLVCAVRRCPYVYYAADIWSDAAQSAGTPGWIVAGVRALERWALRGAAAVVAVSDGVADRVRDLTRRDVVTVVRNGIDTSVFAPGAEPPAGPPTIVYAGTTSEWQGADVFIRAMPGVLEQVPDARLIYLGQGTAWEHLRELAERTAPESIEFRGPVPPAAAADILAGARIGAVSLRPGQGYDFAVPTKIFATIACGTPVLFAGQGASVEVITPELGRSVDWDAASVAVAITEMLTAPDRPEERTARARWAAAHASLAATGRAAAAVVESAARRPRQSESEGIHRS
ncbi:MAG TPA: glycosyltransferase family 4 protein [Agromyces sp.]